MAISTDSLVEFFGTLDDLDSTSAAVSDGAFSVAGDLASWTNDDDSPRAVVVALLTFGTAPTAGAVVELHGRRLNIADTTKDETTPTDDYMASHMGDFVLENVTTEQIIPIEIDLPNVKSSQEWEFYIANRGGQTLSAGWSLQITPKTVGPHA